MLIFPTLRNTDECCFANRIILFEGNSMKDLHTYITPKVNQYYLLGRFCTTEHNSRSIRVMLEYKTDFTDFFRLYFARVCDFHKNLQ